MKNTYKSEVKEVIEYMNDKYTKNFRHKGKYVQHYTTKLLQDYSVEEIKAVIDNRYNAWICVPVMHKYFRPSTIFDPSNFSKYFDDTFN
tara:strand:+ start:1073 stop:1339 length:267 start_codon:yes stop_codon:yes gene_type:complete